MVTSAINSALSGLNASSLRLSASAQNIANAESTSQEVGGQRIAKPYQPVDVVQSSVEQGGVQASLRQSVKEPALRYEPDSSLADANGLVAYPDSDIVADTANRILATNQFKANLKVIEAADEATKSLLDEVA